MKKYIEEYRISLKHREAEEIADLLFYRPVAFFLVKIIYRWPVTPNQISLLSVVSGIASAMYFASGEAYNWRVGALLLLAGNLLDCLDGQLARLQGSGTFFGRIVDGVADYITGIAVFIALGVGLKSESTWIFVILAAASSVLHGMAFDYYQGEFLKSRKNHINISSDDVRQYLKNNKAGTVGFVFRKMLGQVYLFYLRTQNKSFTLFSAPDYRPDDSQGNGSRMIRLWSFLGPSTNRSVLIIFSFFGMPVFYLFAVLIGGNLWFAICHLLQSSVPNCNRSPK